MLEREPYFAFVVDTETYAGNFERPLCAYITGKLGECEVGKEEAEEFKQKYPTIDIDPFDDKVKQVPDEHGCRRPVAIWPTIGWFNDGWGGHYRESDASAEEEAQKNYRVSCLERADRKPYADDAANQRDAAEWLQKAEQKFTKHPAYMSVAIFFYKQPSAELIGLMKERAAEYCDRENITLAGFRLVQISLREEYIQIP